MAVQPPADHVALAKLLDPHLAGYTVVDVGAHGTAESEVYAPALLAPGSQLIGFEADAAECARLNHAAPASRRYYPYVIGDGQTGKFHRCQSPLTSSLLPPNRALLRHYESLTELCTVIEEVTVDTRCLDEVEDIDAVDVLKLDIQGATLPALAAAPAVLGRTAVIHAETEFVPIYQGEAVFSDCEIYLRQRGFMFHHFHRMEGRRMLAGSYAVGRRPSQSLWADAVFVPSLERLDQLAAPTLVRLAWTMHALYGACDFAMACFRRCANDDLRNLATDYRRLLEVYDLLT